MLRPTDILYGIALPFAIALLTFAITWRPWQKREMHPSPSRCIAGIGIVIAFAAAYLMVQGILPRPIRFPPRDSTHWLLFFTPMIAIAALLDATVRAKGWIRVIGAVILGGTFIALLLWKPIVSAQWLALAIGATVVVILAAEQASHRARGIALPIVLTMFAGSIAIVIGTSGSQKLALVAGAVAAASSAGIVVALWRGRPFDLSRGGGAMVIALLAVAVLICGKFFASVSTAHLIMLLAMPVIAWVASMLPLKRQWLRLSLIVALSAAPAVVAGTQSIIRFREEAAAFL